MRVLDSATSTAMQSQVVRGIYYVRLCFDSGDMAWHSGYGAVTVGGVTYQGAGQLASVSSAKEESGVKASGMTVGLSGINEEIVAAMMTEPYINRKAFIYFVPLDSEDVPVSDSPKLLFRGTIDTVSGEMGSSASFSVSLKSRFADWERPRKILYTDVEQQQLHPGDKGMEYIAQLSQKKIIWPRAAYLPDPRD